MYPQTLQMYRFIAVLFTAMSNGNIRAEGDE
jgi:hypothetical protein